MTDTSSNDSKKNYLTFDKELQKKILFEIELILELNYKLREDSPDDFNDFQIDLLLNCMQLGSKKITVKMFNVILRKVIPNYQQDFDDSNKSLTDWRQRIRRWVINLGKPERRGGPKVPEEYKVYFNCELEKIFDSLPARNFKELRRSIIPVLEGIHNNIYKNELSKVFCANVCSKHWWYGMLEKKENEAIKKRWESIPLEKSLKAICKDMTPTSMIEDRFPSFFTDSSRMIHNCETPYTYDFMRDSPMLSLF